jgi:hypothetical protein
LRVVSSRLSTARVAFLEAAQIVAADVLDLAEHVGGIDAGRNEV